MCKFVHKRVQDGQLYLRLVGQATHRNSRQDTDDALGVQGLRELCPELEALTGVLSRNLT